MGTHSATTATTTQAAHPWRATVRTMIAVAIAVIPVLGVAVPEVVQVILSETGTALPDSVRAWLLGASAAIVALAGIVTRVMALKSVIQLTEIVAPAIAPAATK